MKHVIIGTAGHVDHGKTLLIKALTGIDTDRLAEEKKRGITIELGFAHLDFDNGQQAGIVDVPGHEKFIKNMLAGAGGIDLAMLVVAADEGFMPQTVEHLNILQLLGIHDGLLVITKCDMVEPEWVDIIRDDCAERVKGTFLEGKPVFEVSAVTGQGIPELKEALKNLVAAAEEKNMRTPFRLPIDRVFSVEGFGTVVTGTLTDGCVSVGDAVEILPAKTEGRIRNLQVHGKDVPSAFAGQRVAINLAGMKKSELERGDAIAKPDSTVSSLMLDVRLYNLKDSRRIIESGSQVHFFHGSAVRLCKVVLLDRKELNPGDNCLAQLRFSQPVATRKGDRFVIRFFSPLETIGGGVVLNDDAPRHKANNPEVLRQLSVLEGGAEDEKLLQTVSGHGCSLPDTQILCKETGLEPDNLQSQLGALCAAGKVLQLLPGQYIASDALDRQFESIRSALLLYHKMNPLHAGMRKPELRQKLFKGVPQPCSDAVLAELAAEGKIKFIADRCALSDFEVHLTKKQTQIREQLLTVYRGFGLESENLQDVLGRFPQKEQTDCKQVVESMISGNDLVMLSAQICICRSYYEDACRKVKAHFDSNAELTMPQLRDILNTSRKYALALLEYYEKNKMLKREGDNRRPGSEFESLCDWKDQIT